MKLVLKFNLIFLAIFGAGSVLIGYMAYRFLIMNARDQVTGQAQLMIENARATRDYTGDQVAPLLETLPAHRSRFLPQTIPFYAATATFDYLRKKYPDYAYKEAALNPTNLRDRAVDWEADLINYFRNHPKETELAGERESSTGPSLYIAHPIAAEPPCLECHSEPGKAPRAVIQHYGNVNGFGWKSGEIVAAQIVSVPMSVPVGIARRAFSTLLIYLVSIFAVALGIIDAALLAIVIRPARKLSDMADRVSGGDMELPELPVQGKDEISTLTASFNRMYVSLRKAFRMLNG